MSSTLLLFVLVIARVNNQYRCVWGSHPKVATEYLWNSLCWWTIALESRMCILIGRHFWNLPDAVLFCFKVHPMIWFYNCLCEVSGIFKTTFWLHCILSSLKTCYEVSTNSLMTVPLFLSLFSLVKHLFYTRLQFINYKLDVYPSHSFWPIRTHDVYAFFALAAHVEALRRRWVGHSQSSLSLSSTWSIF